MVLHWLFAAWRAGETSSCSVQEAGSLRTKGTKDATLGQGWWPGRLLESCWFKSTLKSWRIWRLMSTAMKTPKTTLTKMECGRVCELLPFTLFHPGPQPIKRCCLYSGQVFTQFCDPHANHLWKTLSETLRSVIYRFPRCLHPVELTTKINHHSKFELDHLYNWFIHVLNIRN